MATNLNATFTKTSNGYPYFRYIISEVKQTGRSNGGATFSAKVDFYVNGWAGYTSTARFYIGSTAVGSAFTVPVTGSDTAYGQYRKFASHTFTFSASGLSNSGGTITNIQLQVTSSLSNFNLSTGNRTLDYSSYNTAPSTPGAPSLNVSNNFSEKTSSIRVTWNKPSDVDGNLSGYNMQVSINGGSWTSMGSKNSTASSVYHDYSIDGSRNQSYKFRVQAKDSLGATSGWSSESSTVRPNVFTPPSSVSVSSPTGDVTFSSSSFTLSYADSSNTNTSVSRTYEIIVGNTSVYKGSTAQKTISIISSGSEGAGKVHINTLKSLLASSSYNGNITIKLIASNGNGSSRTLTTSKRFNLRTNPGFGSSGFYVSTSGSTLYKKDFPSTDVSTLASGYVAKNDSEYAHVVWPSATDSLTGGVTYTLEQSWNNSSWTTIYTGTGTSANYAPKMSTSARTLYFRVKATSSHGTTTSLSAISISIMGYKQPVASISNIVRSSTSVSFNVNAEVFATFSLGWSYGYRLKTSSGAAISDKERYYSLIHRGSSSSVNASASGRITIDGLSSSSRYIVEVFASDVSKFASGVSSSYPITEYLPSFHINKYGAGVKGAKATSDIALNVDGVVKSTYLAFPTDTRGSNDNPTVASPIPGIRLDFKQNSTNGVHDGGSYNGVMTIRKYGIGTDWSGGPSSQLSFTDNGNMYIRTGTGTSWGSWAKIYSTRNKPTASEIGAAASSHTHNYINSKGFTPPQTGRTQNHGNVYSYNTSSGSSSTGAPTTYTSVMGFGSGTAGTIEIAGGWTSGGGLWYRQLRDVEDNWYAWKRVYTTDYKPTWSDIQSKPTVLTDGGTHSTVYLNNWFRSKGSSGWYNQDYGGGIYMNDFTWIKTYGSKNFLCDNILRGATIQSNLYEAANSTTNGTNMLEYSSSESMVRVSSTAAKTRFQANTWFHWNLNQGTGATENLEIYFENSSTSRAFRPAGADNNKIDLGSSSARFKKFWGYAYDYTSDSRHKFDIVSLSNKPTGLANNSKLKEAPQSRTDILKEEYDFFKNMPLYDYSLMNAEKNERTTGFLADELMEMNPGIASRFIRENEIDFSIDDDKPNLYCSDDEGEPPVEEEVKKVSTEKETRYSVSIESYIGNIHLVLQETMKKVDKLEEENRILKKRVGALEYDDLVVVG